MITKTNVDDSAFAEVRHTYEMSHQETAWHSGPGDSWHGKISEGSRFTPAENRYHLYIGLFCPFAHRANLVRVLYGLDNVIPVSVMKPFPKGDNNGWPGYVVTFTQLLYNALLTLNHLNHEYD